MLSDIKLILCLETFNAYDEETVAISIPNKKTLEWIGCSDTPDGVPG